MILVDSSVWVAHLRAADLGLTALLEAGQVLCHPLVIGEIAVGNLKNRAGVLGSLSSLPLANVATDSEVLGLIERRRLYGSGVGYADFHLLTAALLTPNARLWTRDRRLLAAAEQLGVAAPA